MSGLDPLNLGNRREWLGNNWMDWFLFLSGVILAIIFYNSILLLLCIPWVENLGFWAIDKLDSKWRINGRK